MAEYIKRTDAICAIKKYQRANCPEYKRDWVTKLTISVSSDIEKDILAIPAEDVVSVVRCKDCFCYADGIVGWCTHWETGCDGTGYCSHGERRADNG